MTYDFDRPQRGVRECPKCKFTMETLRDSSLRDRQAGYLLDYGVRWDPDDNLFTSYLIGWPLRFFWRHLFEPIGSKLIGAWWNRRYRRILRNYPDTLICPHCH